MEVLSTFPVLKVPDAVQCLQELGIAVSESDLKDPQVFIWSNCFLISAPCDENTLRNICSYSYGDQTRGHSPGDARKEKLTCLASIWCVVLSWIPGASRRIVCKSCLFDGDVRNVIPSYEAVLVWWLQVDFMTLPFEILWSQVSLAVYRAQSCRPKAHNQSRQCPRQFCKVPGRTSCQIPCIGGRERFGFHLFTSSFLEHLCESKRKADEERVALQQQIDKIKCVASLSSPHNAQCRSSAGQAASGHAHSRSWRLARRIRGAACDAGSMRPTIFLLWFPSKRNSLFHRLNPIVILTPFSWTVNHEVQHPQT